MAVWQGVAAGSQINGHERGVSKFVVLGSTPLGGACRKKLLGEACQGAVGSADLNRGFLNSGGLKPTPLGKACREKLISTFRSRIP